MSFVIYNKETTETIKKRFGSGHAFVNLFETETGAKIAFTKLVNQGKINRNDYAIAEYKIFADMVEKQEVKINLMSGKPFSQPVNTPLCCDPSSETYWSM